MCAVLGLAARVGYPNIQAALAMPKIFMELNPAISGVTLAALWAADISTAITLLLGAATLCSQDIWKRFVNPSITDKEQMRITRLSVLVIGMITLYFALNARGIIQVLLIGLSLTTAYTVIFLFTVFVPSLCRKNSAFYTTLAGIIGLFVWQLVPAVRVFPHPIFMEWILCVGTFLTIAVLDREAIPTKSTISA